MKYKKISAFVMLGLFGLFALYTVLADPTGAEVVQQVSTSRRSEATTQTLANASALAGNVTELLVNGTSVTQSWQGYYGQVNGTITLDDASGNTLYDWQGMGAATGEIIAVNDSTISDFTNARCVNNTEILAYQTSFGQTPADSDSINKTFNLVGPSFTLAGQAIANCNSTSLYVSGVADATTRRFNQSVLSTGDDGVVFWVSNIRSDVTGFNGNPYDFQMLVPENGHAGDTAVTTYFFYLELS